MHQEPRVGDCEWKVPGRQHNGPLDVGQVTLISTEAFKSYQEKYLQVTVKSDSLAANNASYDQYRKRSWPRGILSKWPAFLLGSFSESITQENLELGQPRFRNS
jgi:hypothetical protein